MPGIQRMHGMGYTEAGVELEGAEGEEPSEVQIDRVAGAVVFAANGGSGRHNRNLRIARSVRVAVLVAAVLSMLYRTLSSAVGLVVAVVLPLPLPSTLSSLAGLLLGLAEVGAEEDYTSAEERMDSCS